MRVAGGEQRALEPALLAHAHAVIFQMRASAARCCEDLLPHRIVDHADLELAALLGRDRDREHGEAVQEIGRAVERIDDPERVVVAAAAALLGEDGVLGVVLMNDFDDGPLGGAVDLTDVVVASFEVTLRALQTRQAADDDFAARRAAVGDVEERMHESR